MTFQENLGYSKLFWLATLLLGVYLYFKLRFFRYWSKLGVPHDSPIVPLGNVPFSYFLGSRITHGGIIKDSYDKYKKHPYHGLYMLNEPILVINDPELIRYVLVKNFQHFCNRGIYNHGSADLLSNSLSRISGDRWKNLRNRLSPTFTSGRMRRMIPLIEEICAELVKTVDDALIDSDVVEMKDITSRFTNDSLAWVAFGFKCNSLGNPQHEFRRYSQMIIDYGKIFMLLTFYAPDLFNYFVYVPKNRASSRDFFMDLFEKVMRDRRDKNIARDDFLNILMELMDKGVTDEIGKLSMTEAIAQTALFFSAGLETTSSLFICCLDELSRHQDVQARLQREIDEAFADSQSITHEKLANMNYLDMVLCETLRKHPSGPVLNRVCLADTELPDWGFTIPKGLRIVVSVGGLHSDPDIYPDPDRFDPERFTPENRAKRHPSTYMPFGEGPRHCIAKRLGILQPKLALCYLLRKYTFVACEKSYARIAYTNNSFVQGPSNEVYLRVIRRTS